MEPPPFDVVTFGETMLRLSSPAGSSLEAADSLDLHPGGAESNTAIGLARLGRCVSWISALPDNPLGRHAAAHLHRWGVDTRWVDWAAESRMGLYFVELGTAPRPYAITYDRANSAVSQVNPESFDLDWLVQGRALHLTGITPALSQGCREVCRALARRAKELGILRTFDVNLRRKLCTPQECRQYSLELASEADLVLCTAEDAAEVFGACGEASTVASRVSEALGAGAVVITLGERGSFGLSSEGTFEVAAIPSVEVDRVGSGDAFAAGVIHGLLEGDLELGMRYGAAMASLKRTLKGDSLTCDRATIEAVMNSTSASILR